MSDSSTKWAILIGINHYMRGPNVPHRWRNLGGCVNDVDQVEQYLLKTQKVKPNNLIKLTSTTQLGSADDFPPPKEDKDKRPTYDNIKAAIQKVTEEASPSDLVYIHYSGHGGRFPTKYPDLKGTDPYALDEGICPADMESGGRPLRDVEIAYLLDNMVEKKLVLTVVLDSCHSGGSVREPDAPVRRGLEDVDRVPFPNDDPIPVNVLQAAWERQGPSKDRVKQSWLLEPSGFEFIAACRSTEYAQERPIGRISQGLVTYSLLSALDTAKSPTTHRMLHGRVNDHVQYLLAENIYSGPQEPVLAGNGERCFFSNDVLQAPSVRSVPVTKVGVSSSGMVFLKAGKAHAVSRGSEYAIYPWDASDITDPTQILAKAIVTEVSDLASKAKIVGSDVQNWPHGCQAVLLRRPVSAQTRIKLQALSGDAKQDDLLKGIRNLDWGRFSNGVVPLGLVGDSDETDYQIVVSDRGEYELRDSTGSPFPGLAPSTTPDAILGNVVQMAKFRMIEGLKNSTSNSQSQIQGKLELKVLDLEPKDGIYNITSGNSINLLFTNNSAVTVNLTIFELESGPVRGIKQIHPEDGAFDTVYPGGRRPIVLTMGVPDGLDVVVDTYKAFATVKPTSFRTLELPPTAASAENFASNWVSGELQPLEAPPPTGSTQGSWNRQDWEVVEITIRTSR